MAKVLFIAKMRINIISYRISAFEMQFRNNLYNYSRNDSYKIIYTTPSFAELLTYRYLKFQFDLVRKIVFIFFTQKSKFASNALHIDGKAEFSAIFLHKAHFDQCRFAGAMDFFGENCLFLHIFLRTCSHPLINLKILFGPHWKWFKPHILDLDLIQIFFLSQN